MDRVNWIDTAKGIGILCVILGHVGPTPHMHALIYSFHMPFFFFLSGIFLFRKRRDFKEEVLRKFRTLMVPYFVFNVIYFFYYFLAKDLFRTLLSVQSTIDYSSLFQFLQAVAIGNREIASSLWFLPCLCISEIFLLLCYSRYRNIYILSFVTMVAGCLFHYFIGLPLPMSLDNVLIASSFIALGGLVHIDIVNHHYYTYISAICIFALCGYLNYEYLGQQGVDMFSCRYGNYLYFYATSITAVFLIVTITKKRPNSRFLLFMGKNSLLIYCTHSITLDISNSVIRYFNFSSDYAFIQAILITALVCLLSYPMAYVVNRYIPWMLGKKKSIKNIQ